MKADEFMTKQQKTIGKNIEEIHLADFQLKVDAMSEEEKLIVLKSIKRTEVILMEVVERVNRFEDRDDAMRKLLSGN